MDSQGTQPTSNGADVGWFDLPHTSHLLGIRGGVPFKYGLVFVD